MPKISRRNLIAGASSLIAAPFVLRNISGGALAKAPMMGMDRPSHYRFKFGEFEITTLNDGSQYRKTLFPMFGQDQFPEDVGELAVANHLPDDKLEIGFTPVIINTGKELVLFDTGNGDVRRPGAGHLVEALKTAGYSAEQVDIVVLTHFHADHIGGAMDDGKPVFANARYVTGETEFDFWMHDDQAAGATAGTHALAQKKVKPLAEKITFLKNESSIVSGITAFASPGHTPGHMTFHVESAGQRIFIGADFCNHYVLSLQRPDWHMAFDMEKDQASQTRRKILDMLATDKIPFTSYHMPFPAVGYVEKKDDGFVYVAASYQLNGR